MDEPPCLVVKLPAFHSVREDQPALTSVGFDKMQSLWWSVPIRLLVDKSWLGFSPIEGQARGSGVRCGLDSCLSCLDSQFQTCSSFFAVAHK